MFARMMLWGGLLAMLLGAIPVGAAKQAVLPLVVAPQTTRPAGVPDAPAPAISFRQLGRYIAPPVGGSLLDKGAAEIVAFDPASDRMFIVNGLTNTIDVVNVANPITPTLVISISVAAYGSGVTSVAVKNGILAAAVPADPTTADGKAVFFDTNGTFLNQVTVGSLPDMITFTPDGSRVLTANEGQPLSYNQAGVTTDPVGSVSVINLTGGVTGTLTAQTAGFAAFNAQEAALTAAGVRIFGPDANQPDGTVTVAQDLEPEYIAVSPDSSTAYVTLQENNALAIIDLATATVTDLIPLGLKDHSLVGNGLDASDRDGPGATRAISITTKPVFGMYMPDSIAAYTAAGGGTYLVTANEGDARAYGSFNEETRAADIFAAAPAGFARLNVTAFPTSTEVLSSSTLYAFGSRSFSIWNGDTGALVFDSGDDIEVRTSQIYTTTFNASHTNNTLDSRSASKGPEPEAATVGTINGRTYAFIGLERISGVMVYDVTTPTAPTFVQYLTNRNFGVAPTDATAINGTVGDLGPEGLLFVNAADSPTGQPLLMVANEVSGSTTIYEIEVPSPDGAGTLSLLHNNDGESTLLPLDISVAPNTGYTNTTTETIKAGGIAAFKTVIEREIADARTLGNAVMNVYAGDAFLASATLQCSLDNPNGPVYDAIGQAAIPYTAHVFGNHEFDYSPDFLKRFVDAFGGTQPFLSANLNFSGEPSFVPLLDNDGILFSPLAVGDKIIGSSLVYTDSVTNQRFGIVGLTTNLLPTISTPRNVTVTPTITETATVAQAAIDTLYNNLGIRKIVLVSHLQDLRNDRELIKRLKRVDLAVAGGGDELLSNPNIPNNVELLPGDRPFSENNQPLSYPLVEQDADSRSVYLVTTNGNYKYVGRLDVVFDESGEISQVISEKSYPRRVVETGTGASNTGLSDAVIPDAGLVTSVVTPVTACLAVYAQTAVVRSEVTLDVSRLGVRSKETNAGNLIADGLLDAYRKYSDNIGVTVPLTRVVAVQNSGGIRQNAGNVLPRSGTPGVISQLDTINVLSFDNFVNVVQNVTPAELKAILEHAASTLPGQGGQFLQIAGMKVVYDLRNTAQVTGSPPVGEVAGSITTPGSRVVSITLNDGTKLVAGGVVVAGAPNVAVIANNFTGRGGDNYAIFEEKPASNKRNLINDAGVPISYEQAWREYLLSFPASGSPSLPTVAASDTRYKVGGEGRILVLNRSLYLPIIRTP
jgi:2',3'-cyclic-nucleotide 2'-phosphodiesterase / 3'-nucleotidase / 5'-nucleotidase